MQERTNSRRFYRYEAFLAMAQVRSKMTQSEVASYFDVPS